MVVDSEELKRSLLRKGFVTDETDHHMYRHQYNGRYTGVETKLSHGSRYDIRDGLLGKHKRQMRFSSSKQVLDFAKCHISADDYNAILIRQNIFQ